MRIRRAGKSQLVEIAVIVRDHHDGGAGLHQFRQQFVVKFAPEFGVLFGRPFVQQQDRPLLEQADDEREPPALAARQIERAKFAVRRQPVLSSRRNCASRRSTSAGVRIGDPVEPLEQMIVEENRRDQAAVGVARIVVDAHAVERDLAGVGRIEPGEHPQERRFARAVAAGDEDEFAGLQVKSIGPIWNAVVRKFVGVAERRCRAFRSWSNRFGTVICRAASDETVARSSASSCSIRSAAALAFSKIGIDCTRPKHAPTMNMSAVVVLVMDAPPSAALNCGATNTTAPSRMYIVALRRSRSA